MGQSSQMTDYLDLLEVTNGHMDEELAETKPTPPPKRDRDD